MRDFQKAKMEEALEAKAKEKRREFGQLALTLGLLALVIFADFSWVTWPLLFFALGVTALILAGIAVDFWMKHHH